MYVCTPSVYRNVSYVKLLSYFVGENYQTYVVLLLVIGNNTHCRTSNWAECLYDNIASSISIHQHMNP